MITLILRCTYTFGPHVFLKNVNQIWILIKENFSKIEINPILINLPKYEIDLTLSTLSSNETFHI